MSYLFLTPLKALLVGKDMLYDSNVNVYLNSAGTYTVPAGRVFMGNIMGANIATGTITWHSAALINGHYVFLQPLCNSFILGEGSTIAYSVADLATLTISGALFKNP